MSIDRPQSQLEILYARMVKVIEDHGGRAPGPNEPASLSLMADFCWALGVVPQIQLLQTETKE